MRNWLIILLLVACCSMLPYTGQAADNAPGLMYSTLLNGFNWQSDSAMLRLNGVQAVFLPDPNSGNTSFYPYDPEKGGQLWATLSDGSGKELYTLRFFAEDIKAPYWLLSSYTLYKAGSDQPIYDEQMDLSAMGDFVLDFYLESGKFYTFPFSVSKVASDDPFAGSDTYFLDGPWSDWAYFFYYDAKPDQSLLFKAWLRHKTVENQVTVVPMLEIKRGGKLFCTSRENITYRLKKTWNRFEFTLNFPMQGTSGGGYVKARDLLANDGEYTATLLLDGRKQGSWKFSVKGGKLVPHPRADRKTADPLTFVEGGRDAFWYQK